MARKIFEQDKLPVSSLNLDKGLIDRLWSAGFRKLGQLRMVLPRDISQQCRLSVEEAELIGLELRRVYQRSSGDWNAKTVRRQIRNAERAQRKEAEEPHIDESVMKRFIHRAATGAHYKKPRKKGLL